jgi:hypothetical protein
MSENENSKTKKVVGAEKTTEEVQNVQETSAAERILLNCADVMSSKSPSFVGEKDVREFVDQAIKEVDIYKGRQGVEKDAGGKIIRTVKLTGTEGVRLPDIDSDETIAELRGMLEFAHSDLDVDEQSKPPEGKDIPIVPFTHVSMLRHALGRQDIFIAPQEANIDTLCAFAQHTGAIDSLNEAWRNAHIWIKEANRLVNSNRVDNQRSKQQMADWVRYAWSTPLLSQAVTKAISSKQSQHIGVVVSFIQKAVGAENWLTPELKIYHVMHYTTRQPTLAHFIARAMSNQLESAFHPIRESIVKAGHTEKLASKHDMNIEVFTNVMIDAFAVSSFTLSRAVGDVNVMLTAFQALRMAALAGHGEASQVFVDSVLNHENFAQLASNATIMRIALFKCPVYIKMADKAHLWKTAVSLLHKLTYIDGDFCTVPLAEATSHVSVYIDADNFDRPKTVLLAGSVAAEDNIETFGTVNSWSGDSNYLRVCATPENASFIARLIEDLSGHYTTDHIADMLHYMTINRTNSQFVALPQASVDMISFDTVFMPDLDHVLFDMAAFLATRTKLRILNEGSDSGNPQVKLVYELDNLQYPMGLRFGRGGAMQTCDPRLVIAARGAVSSSTRLMMPARYVSVKELADVVVPVSVLKTQRNYVGGKEGTVRDTIAFDMVDERLIIQQEDPLSITGLKSNRTDAMLDIPNKRALTTAIWSSFVDMVNTVLSDRDVDGKPVPPNPAAVQQIVEWTVWLLKLGGNPWTGKWAGASYCDELAQKLLDRALMRAGDSQEQSRFYRALRAREHSLEYRVLYKLHMFVHVGLLEKKTVDQIVERLQAPIYSTDKSIKVNILTLIGRAQFEDGAHSAPSTEEQIQRASENVVRR